ncbi:midasin [Wallemia mellicola]|uniref:Midasin n=1 Tax=Wallemia mellicola TaxID=1708541 RepID=A0AB74KD81_9BASI|nr:midasin [Wallemia mellicola]TIC45251.1 midasin [Wallemia mellicola]TIC65625.1 midasin [Wallemia mellicola]
MSASGQEILLNIAQWLDQDISIDRISDLSLVLPVHSELTHLTQIYLESCESPINFDKLQPTPELQKILLAIWRFTQCDPGLVKHWQLLPLIHVISTHEDQAVRLLSTWIITSFYDLSIKSRNVLLGKFVDFSKVIPLRDGSSLREDGQLGDNVVDARNLLLIEEARISNYKQSLKCTSDISIDTTNNLSLLASNVLISRQSKHAPQSNYIPTPALESSLIDFSIAYSTRLPTILSSPPSSGKSTIINHLSSVVHPPTTTHPHILTIHAADPSLDPKALLGSYVSTPQGTFAYVEGALVKAVRSGMWVVIRDIDRASQDFMSIISKLAQSLGPTKKLAARAVLSIPGRNSVTAHPDFRLMATKSTTLQSSFLGYSHWFEVNIPEPSIEDVTTIVAGTFPKLSDVASNFVGVWQTAKEAAKIMRTDIKSGAERPLVLRDLFRWVRRIEKLFEEVNIHPKTIDDLTRNPIVQEEILIEAIDVFYAHKPAQPAIAVLETLGDQLHVNSERIKWIANSRSADYKQSESTSNITIGRTQLKAASAMSLANKSKSTFALTKPSLNLMEKIAVGVSHSEPLLLVGETGTGKTTMVSYLAKHLNRKLVSLNLSHQTEASDLLGSFRPLDPRAAAVDVWSTYEELFNATFDTTKNKAFTSAIRKSYVNGKWEKLSRGWQEATKMARIKLSKGLAKEESSTESPRKKRKTNDHSDIKVLSQSWDGFENKVNDFIVQHVNNLGGKARFVFSFVEGPLVTALRRGDWILLDEVNLASPETLECLSSLVASPNSSIVLTERGDLEAIPRHPDFRIFACMNPATDVGKRNLPQNLREKFTEIYSPAPDNDKDALVSIVDKYIGQLSAGDKGVVMDVAELYHTTKMLAEAHEIADGANQRPHYSMRTLARALSFAATVTPIYGLRRSLWEGWIMAFTMPLSEKSANVVKALAEKHIVNRAKNPRTVLNSAPPKPTSDDYLGLGSFWLERGPLPLEVDEGYILTPSVQAKLIDLARVVLTRRFPVLIQGPTSAGKTSAVEYLAKRTGHSFVRINNHEHTDLQEYLGTYVSDPDTGKFEFQEGVLVRALRNGDWIVLDELNLAPTDVLEALNRLLDDNRELVIPETGEVVKPHPHFMLFATQNPPGLYAGRKVLSRAFRNRFLEVHFDDVPQDELETILCQRCKIAPSYANKIVAVFRELQRRRQAERVFETKQSFATLRDLFRWAKRDVIGYQQLAENGYMLLAERARRPDDKVVVKEVVQDVMKVTIDTENLYNLSESDMTEKLGCVLKEDAGMVWTKAAKRLFILVAMALKYDEPVLLVGDTGTGKTSVCQVLAAALNQRLRDISCHENIETADILGGQRPIRNRAALQSQIITDARELLGEGAGEDVDEISNALNEARRDQDASQDKVDKIVDLQSKIKHATALFEWHDGPLVEAMRNGDLLLMDEISLADDAVLERLNSVLEPSRSLVLAERGGKDIEQLQVTASTGFQIIATMNPGGDFGKKELSPALRNRFTEIWVPAIDDHDDLEMIIKRSWNNSSLDELAPKMLEFVAWFTHHNFGGGGISTTSIGLRDLIAWAKFLDYVTKWLDPQQAFVHGAALSIFDGLHFHAQEKCLEKAISSIGASSDVISLQSSVSDTSESFSIGPFSVTKGNFETSNKGFSFMAPTTRLNGMKVLRALQVPKPILLEGSPGVGKTSLIAALADSTSRHLVRINLSDQTDLMDLFGSDLPVEGGKPGEFAWRDAAFLSAMQEGHWVLLDEMNLASQSVLEGLNAVLDHRGSVFLPELGRHFNKHPSFRVFAAQNPLQQGGGRKGLPQSFLNRFSKVYVQELTAEDLLIICQQLYPSYPKDILAKMIEFNSRLEVEIVHKRAFGRDGAPWEFNLRDILRWLQLLHIPSSVEKSERKPSDYLYSIYLSRLRTDYDRQSAANLFKSIFNEPFSLSRPPYLISDSEVQIGNAHIARGDKYTTAVSPTITLQSHLHALQTLTRTFDMGWLAIVVGQAATGKTSLARHFAALSGRKLHEFDMNAGVDTMELLGSFEQADATRIIQNVLNILLEDLDQHLNINVNEQQFMIIDTNRNIVKAAQIEFAKNGNKAIEVINESVAKVFQSQVGLSPQTFELVNKLLKDYNDQSSQSEAGRFEWVDGVLLRAMKNGDWLLIDDANLCSPSVLDRLNSLFETNGSLVLSERGMVNNQIQTIKPHPDFRMIMTLDPRHGELSRAMRNRGIEIFLSPPTTLDKESIRSMARIGSSPDLSLMENAVNAQKVSRGLVAQEKQVYFKPWVNISAVDPDVEAISKSAHALSCGLDKVSIDAGLLQLVRTLSLHRLKSSTVALQLLKNEKPDRLVEVIDKVVQSSFAQSRGVNSSMPINTLAFDYGLSDDEALYIGYVVDMCTRMVIASVDWEWRKKFASRVNPKTLTILDRAALIQAKKNVPSNTPENVNELGLVLQRQKQLGNIIESFSTTRVDLNTLKSFERLVDLHMELEKTADDIHFDYSAMQVVLEMIRETLTQVDAPDQIEAIDALATTVEMKSGQGLNEIWSSLLPDIRDGRVDELIKGLKSYSKNLKPEMRDSFVDIFASLGLSDIAENVYALADDLLKELSSISGKPKALDDTRKDAVNAAFDVALETSMIDSPHMFQITTTALLKRLSQDLHVDPLSIIGLKQAVWVMQVKPGKVSSPIYLNMLISWMARTWSLQDGHFSGPADLLRPLTLRAIAERCSRNKKRSVKDIGTIHQNLHKDAKALALNSASYDKPRQLVLKNVLVTVIVLMFNAFAGHIDSNEDVKEEVLNVESTEDVDVNKLRRLASKCQHKEFRDIAEHLLCPALEVEVTDSRSISKAWINVSIACLNLYIPNFALDPSVPAQSKRSFGQRREERLIAELEAAKEYERITSGNESNALIKFIEDRLASVRSESTYSTGVTVHRSTDLSLLTALYQELHHFANQAYASDRFITLVDKIESSLDDQVLFQEQTIQSNIEGFLRRLDGVYAFYEDLIHPIRLFLHVLRVGLRTLTHTCRVQDPRLLGDAVPINSVVKDVARFSLVASLEHLQSNDLPEESMPNSDNTSPPTKLLLLDLSALAFEEKLGLSQDKDVQRYDRACAALYERWSADRQREQLAAEEATSLYRPHNLDEEILDDAEAEEAEFKALFPEFDDVLNVDTAAAKAAGITTSDAQTLVTKEDILAVYQLHLAICGGISDDSFAERRNNLIKDSVVSTFATLSNELDHQTYSIQVGLLADQIRQFESAGDIASFNFYHDADIAQNRLARDVVERLSQRLLQIFEDWPEQLILQHLNERCEAILRMDYRCPLAGMLSALEMLLMQTEDWESNASREVSLRDNRDEIVGLIVSWRRMELATWATLLERQELMFKNDLSVWWFRFYETIVHGLEAASASEDSEQQVTKHLSTVVELLDKFLYSSWSGHYSPKLALVKSFAELLDRLSSLRSYDAFKRASKLLGGIYSYYSQFEQRINENMQSKRDDLERKIQDWIKMASWKDVNVFALRSSAQKTHRQLHKSIRTFRDILNQPVESFLSQDSENRAPIMLSSRPITLLSSNTLEELDDGSQRPIAPDQNHLRSLPSLYEKLQQKLSVVGGENDTEALDDLSTTIIEKTQEFRKATPMHITEENKSTVKSLTAQKHRAWGDLLKELKRLGLSPNLRADLASLLRDSSRLFQLPNLTGSISEGAALSDTLRDLIPKADNYNYRVLALLPRLRVSLAMHAEDISTRDLTRALNFVESAMAIAVKNTQLFSRTLQSYNTVTSLTERLMDFDSSNELADSQYNCAQVVSLKNFFISAQNVFNDALKSIQEYLQISKAASHTSSEPIYETVTSLQGFVSSTNDVAMKLSGLQAMLHGYSLFTKDNVALIERSFHELSKYPQVIEELIIKTPSLSHVLKPTLEWLDEKSDVLRVQEASNRNADIKNVWLQSDALINSVLIVAQSVKEPQGLANEDLDLTENAFGIAETSLKQLVRIARVESITGEINKLFDLLSRSPSQHINSSSVALKRSVPFIRQYIKWLSNELDRMMSWHKASLKFAHILASTFLSVAEKGFCKPDEKDNGESDEQGDGKLEEGTGLGEGEGAENISNQIQNEEQVEGLKDEGGEGDEKNDDEKEKTEAEDQAIEMNEDFDGDLDDASDRDGEEGEERDEENMDEQMGDADPLDPGAVDEKMWNDENDQESGDKDDHVDNDAKGQGESETVANEDTKQSNKEDKPEQGEEAGEEEAEQQNEMGDEKEEMPEAQDEGPGEDDEGAGPDKGDHLNNELPEPDMLDLPEGMDLDNQQKEQEAGEDEDDEGFEDGEMGENDDMDNAGEEEKGESEEGGDEPRLEEAQRDEGEGDEKENEEAMGDNEESEKPDAERNEEKEADDEGEDEKEQATDTTGDQPQAQQQDALAAPQQADNGGGMDEGSQDDSGAAQGTSGQQAEANTNDASMQQTQDQAQESQPTEFDPASQAQGQMATNENTEASRDQPQDQQADPNPLRSLGDAMQEFRRRFDEIAEAQERPSEGQEKGQEEQIKDDQPLEYVKEGDEDANDTQALGAAPEEHVEKLNDLQIADEEKEAERDAEMDFDDDEQVKNEAGSSNQMKQIDTDAKAPEADEGQPDAMNVDEKTEERIKEEQDEDMLASDSEEKEEIDQAAELKLMEWTTSGEKRDSKDVWKIYESMTRDLSFGLCEQLRLILEPTLATRLKGDYRTGKRLNMKKIIPYIASEFTKDKIWLRRTRPSKREYQVLLALDDSKSMSDVHTIHLAFQSLALISKALTTLEVGSIAISKFGKSMDILHSFEDGIFTDDEGAKVLDSFTFAQTETNVHSLVDTSLNMLGDAREGQRDEELHQLMFVLSDGICSNHEKMARLLRRAQEDKVLIVFVVLDSLKQESNSILNMTQASYKMADGRPQLSVESKWHNKYKKLSTKAKVVPLPKDFIMYLNEDGIVMPIECNPNDSGDDSDEEAVQPPSFPQLSLAIRAAIEKYGVIIPKLNWSTPIDARWIHPTNTINCTTLEEVYLLLKSSDFVAGELAGQAFEGCVDSPPETIEWELALKQHIEISRNQEFRVFVRDNKIAGICQRDLNFYEFLQEEETQENIRNLIKTFWDENVKETFPNDNYVMDVYINQHDRVIIVDFNVYALRTDSLLFSYEELQQAFQSNELLFKVIDTPSDPLAQTGSYYASSAVPKDLIDASQGAYVAVFMMFSLFIKERLYIGEAVTSTVFGIIIGPYVGNGLDFRTWGSNDGQADEEITNEIILEVTRIVLALGVFAIGVELPKQYMRKHWKSIFMLIIPIMSFGWVISAAFIYALIPDLTYVSSLTIAATLTPTDPILAAAVIGGKFAQKHVPSHARHLLFAESGCNDGAAFPFLYIGIFLLLSPSDVPYAVEEWFLVTWLYEVALGIFLGALIGYCARKLMKFCEGRNLIDRQSFVAQYVSLTLLTIGIGLILGSDDLLAAFSCGTAFAWDGFFNKATEESHFSSILDLLFNCACFIFIGALAPFDAFNDPSLGGITNWRLVILGLCILLCRRLPIMLALYKWIPDVKTFREACFAGWFGPMGVGAVFIATLAATELPFPEGEPQNQAELVAVTIQPIVWFMVLVSTFIHGLSIPFFSLGRRVNTIRQTTSFGNTLSRASLTEGNDWLHRMRQVVPGQDIVINRDDEAEKGSLTQSSSTQRKESELEGKAAEAQKVLDETSDDPRVQSWIEGNDLVIERPRSDNEDDTEATVFQNVVSDDMREQGRHSIVASVALEIEKEIKDKLLIPISEQAHKSQDIQEGNRKYYAVNHKPGTKESIASKLFQHRKTPPAKPEQSYRPPSSKDSFNDSIDKQTGQSIASPESNSNSAGIRFIDEEDPNRDEPHIHPADKE